MNGSDHVVVGENVIEVQVLDGFSKSAHSDRIASEFDLRVRDTDFHVPQPFIDASEHPRSRFPALCPKADTVTGCFALLTRTPVWCGD
jgi:hypothetical protein